MSQNPLKVLIEELSKLPGIGKRSAERIAIHILKMDEAAILNLINALQSVKTHIHPCSICFYLSESDPCQICNNPAREHTIICVVEDPMDVLAFEKGGEYKGIYHVLGGKMSPLKGIGPNDLHIKELIQRVNTEPVKEVILATNPDVEGEATALYIAKELESIPVTVTRIGLGVPVGGSLEYADQRTLQKALEGRQKFS